jgi:RHH-type proline utilization regulon transcriptional repressor/proline dehydrogenase/delta 1-pyrroline-5-carboxylate dehydrogenase
MSHDTIQRALKLARELQQRATELQTPAERRQQAELDRMLQTPSDKATLVQLTDQAFRAKSSARVVDQFTHILDVQGVPRFFSPLDRAMLRGFQTFGGWLPGVSVPMVKSHMQQETANVILPAEPELLGEHLNQRREQGVRMNVNFLGEAILSEAEAERRMEQYLKGLQAPETEVFSVKISTLYSQMSPMAREHTISTVCDRLERLYRSASRATFMRADGTRVPKFIYLDMEEYRDLSLTCEVFMRTLTRRGLDKVGAGIAMQAYIPDTARWQRLINEWARERVAKGGAPVTIRLVKGANMEMERFEAALKGWPQAPYKTKRETDANYKRMLLEGMKPENLAAVRLGIASHNLFDVAYALVLVLEADAMEGVQFEMLEGMANHQRRALFERITNLLLYAPVCRKEHFLSAIGYLIRRLDENTGPENFLRHTFKLTTNSTEWRELEQGFLEAFELLPTLSDAPRRTQDRRVEQRPSTARLAEARSKVEQNPTDKALRFDLGRLLFQGGQYREALPELQQSKSDVRFREEALLMLGKCLVAHFTNEPDTDWSLPQHAEWAQQIVAKWQPRCDANAVEIPLVIDGAEVLEQRTIRECNDPSRPGTVAGRYRQASGDDIVCAVTSADRDDDGWRSKTYAERGSILQRAAQELRTSRADLMGAAIADGGKTLMESDPEVSEAVDFVEFYAESARWFAEEMSPDIKAQGKGVVVVVSPWNFPIAIPCGGIAAALAAGNTVILKPASDAVLVAWELCQCFWRGGISRKALQFVPCSGGQEGSALVQHPKVDAVILTGGTETALTMLRAKPDMRLSAETGGKNATIVTALSDRDQAIKNVLHSAFSHAGQKCSATSLLLLEAEVYDDPEFKRALVEAAESITVGSAWDVRTKMGPLIRPPSGDLENALLTLEVGESWALMPGKVDDNPHLWSPGIKWGVQPGSYTHLTEFFGPVLGVMRFEKLHEAIALVNQTGFGLTSGLESLDDREQAEWKAGIRAGNLYMNRGTTGAIVLRQPFGGMGKSAFGPGLKAGGPNYVAQFMEFTETQPKGDLPTPSPDSVLGQLLVAMEGWNKWSLEGWKLLCLAFASYEKAWREEFGREHDHFLLPGQDNLRRYLPVNDVRVRVVEGDSPFSVFARVVAARIAGCRIVVSLAPGVDLQPLQRAHEASHWWANPLEFLEESDEELARAIHDCQCDRVRYAHPSAVPLEVRRAANEANVFIADFPVLAEGRIELLWYVREQSVSFDYHRYGNLGSRAAEARAEPL